MINKWIDVKKCVENYYNNQSMGLFIILGQIIFIKVCSIVLDNQSKSVLFCVLKLFFILLCEYMGFCFIYDFIERNFFE